MDSKVTLVKELVRRLENQTVVRIFDAVWNSNHFKAKIYVTETESNKIVVVATYGTGPLACLSLFPVADLDKVSWD